MNQHYVPRSYLKNFAEKKRKEFFVNVYDKKENRYFQANIKKICSEINLYTLKENNNLTNDLFTIEKLYSNGFEPLYLKAYGILTNHSIYYISQLQRVEILIAIFQLYVRNPAILRRTISFHKREINKIYSESKKKGLKGITYLAEDFSFRDWSEKNIVDFFEDKLTNDFKENHIGGIGEIGNFHENAIFEISVIEDDSEFLTSDNPMVLEDSISDNLHPLLKSKEFFLALNKKVSLKLYHDNTKSPNRIYRKYIPNASVAVINKIVLNQTSRFVISSKEALEKHSKISEDFLDNTSLELKIDAIRQILTKFPITQDNKALSDVLREYLNLYEIKGNLTDEEVYEMHTKIKKIKFDFITKRINN